MKSPVSFIRILAVGLCFAGVSAAHAQSLKVGIVDMNKVFSGYYKTKDAETKINDAREVAKKELDDRMESHKQLLEEINTLNKDIDNPALNSTGKGDRQKKRDDKIHAGALAGERDQRVQDQPRTPVAGTGRADAQHDCRGDHDYHQQQGEE